MSKVDAHYVNHPERGERCATCSMYRAPESCTLVDGKIRPNGHCAHWDGRKRL